jgi:two-component system, LytTR family, response regulator
MNKLRVIIIDDEPIARDRTRGLLQGFSERAEIIAEYGNGPEAIAGIVQHQPDVIFIDVQMPGCNGLQVVKALPADRRPAVVFVTAYEQFAVDAFSVQAVDYLLKPFDAERFELALNRATDFVRARKTLDPKSASGPEVARNKNERLTVKVDGKVVFLRPEEIRWIEAADNYVILHVAARRMMVRETLSSIEERLGATTFARVNRSAIVNIEQVQELHPTFHGDYTVVLRDGTQLPLSRSLRGKLGRFSGDGGAV